jgi:prepilin-type N-terminal cleavage/methylation domain-containing protein
MLLGKNSGFTLIEVIISTVMMSMMMFGMLNFVNYSGIAWKKGQEKMDASSYSRMVYECLKRDLLSTSEIGVPLVGNASDSIILANNIKNRQGQETEAKFLIMVDSNNVLVKKILAVTSGKTIDYTGIDDGLSANTIFFARHYEAVIARRVMDFEVYRETAKTLKVHLLLGREVLDDATGLFELEAIASQTFTFLVPGG